MNTNDKDNNIVNNMANTLLSPANDLSRFYAPVAVAGAALLGGALYYYMNNKNSSSTYACPKLIDYKNQTREVKVRNWAGLVWTG